MIDPLKNKTFKGNFVNSGALDFLAKLNKHLSLIWKLLSHIFFGYEHSSIRTHGIFYPATHQWSNAWLDLRVDRNRIYNGIWYHWDDQFCSW